MNGEFTRDARVTLRTHHHLKKQVEDSKYSHADAYELGARMILDEPQILEFEKHILEEDINSLLSIVHEKEEHLAAINKQLIIRSPDVIDDEMKENMLVDAAVEYAEEIYARYGDESLEKMQLKVAKGSLFSFAKELGYDEVLFKAYVVEYLESKCHTRMSDISAEDL